MSQQLGYQFKISSSLGIAIFDCLIYSNWRVNIVFDVNFQAILVKFRSGTAGKASVQHWQNVR